VRLGIALSVMFLALTLFPLPSLVRPASATCFQASWGDCTYTWGYTDRNHLGWLAPSNTTILTPLVTNKSATNWIESQVFLFPFHVEPSTSVVFGLYADGKLIASSSYQNLSENDAGGYGGSCTAGVCGSHMVKSVFQDLAVFSDWTWELDLYHQIGWLASIPSGATLVVAFESSKPLWVSIDNQTSGHSYYVGHSAFTNLPGNLPANGSQSPHAVAVWIYSPNPNASGGPGTFSFLQWGLISLGGSLLIAVTAFTAFRRAKVKLDPGPKR
jgi:hypothetical protein